VPSLHRLLLKRALWREQDDSGGCGRNSIRDDEEIRGPQVDVVRNGDLSGDICIPSCHAHARLNDAPDGDGVIGSATVADSTRLPIANPDNRVVRGSRVIVAVAHRLRETVEL